MPRPRPKHHHRAVFYPDSLGIAAPAEDGRGLGYTQAWHRTSWEQSPYCVVNELIAAELGTFLRLPIPPFAITYADRHRCFFSSLDFNFDRDELPPVEPDLCWTHLPSLTTGVLLFDILIANEDRHDQNLVVDKVSRPKVMRVFDHDQALLGGGGKLKGVARLQKLTHRLGVTGGTVTGGNRHCLLDVVSSTRHFPTWLQRIDDIPDWLINESCDAARGLGINNREAKDLAESLRIRRNTLPELIDKNRAEFTAIEQWSNPRNLF